MHTCESHPLNIHKWFCHRTGLAECLLASKNLEPLDLALAVVCLLHGLVKHKLRRAPDVWASAITLDKRDDRVVGNLKEGKKKKEEEKKKKGRGRKERK